MINHEQHKVLTHYLAFKLVRGDEFRVHALKRDKYVLEKIEKENPGTVVWFFLGKPCTVQSDPNFNHCFGKLTNNAQLLVNEYDAKVIVGYDGTAREVRSGLEFAFHYRARTMSQLRSQIKRGHGYKACVIVKAEPLTHDQWCTAYGWGKM